MLEERLSADFAPLVAALSGLVPSIDNNLTDYEKMSFPFTFLGPCIRNRVLAYHKQALFMHFPFKHIKLWSMSMLNYEF